jgi:hypothetical protein
MAGMNERVISLLDMVGLRERAIKADDAIMIEKILKTPIDWAAVDQRLDLEREKFKRYIMNVGL